MFILGVKYQLSKGGHTEAFRFRDGATVIAHNAGVLPSHLALAIEFALGKKTSTEINAVMLQITDEDGDHWTIDRSQERLIVKRNRELVEGNDPLAELAKTVVSKDEENHAELVTSFDLSGNGARLKAKRRTNSLSSQDRLNALAETKRDAYQQKCIDFLGEGAPISLETLQNFGASAEECFDNLRLIDRQLLLAENNLHEKANFGSEVLDQLNEELVLLQKLSDEAQFFDNPANNIRALKEDLATTESQLKDLCEANDIVKLPPLQIDCDWDQVIGALARLQAYQRLEVAYRNTVQEVESACKPVFQDHLQAAKSFLLDDKSLLDNIQTSLHFITQKLQELADPVPATPKLNLWRKIMDPQSEPLKQESIDPNLLQGSRASVDHILGAINQMCSHLEAGSESYSERFDEIQTRYEKIVRELARAKERWQKVAAANGIKANTSLKCLLGIIQNYGKISGLYHKKKELEESCKGFKRRLERCRVLVEEWRYLTNSQKSSDLSQSAIVIQEIRALMAMKPSKETQLEKLTKVFLHNQYYRKIYTDLKTQHQKLEAKWQQLFRLICRKPSAYNDRKWPDFFRALTKTEICSDLIVQSRRPLVGESIFSQEYLNGALNIFYINSEFAASSQVELLRLVEFHNPLSSILFIFQGVELKNRFQTSGIVTSEVVKLRAAATPAKLDQEKPVLEKVKSSDPIMSEKARAALELFKARNIRT